MGMVNWYTNPPPDIAGHGDIVGDIEFCGETYNVVKIIRGEVISYWLDRDIKVVDFLLEEIENSTETEIEDSIGVKRGQHGTGGDLWIDWTIPTWSKIFVPYEFEVPSRSDLKTYLGTDTSSGGNGLMDSTTWNNMNFGDYNNFQNLSDLRGLWTRYYNETSLWRLYTRIRQAFWRFSKDPSNNNLSSSTHSRTVLRVFLAGFAWSGSPVGYPNPEHYDFENENDVDAYVDAVADYYNNKGYDFSTYHRELLGWLIGGAGGASATTVVVLEILQQITQEAFKLIFTLIIIYLALWIIVIITISDLLSKREVIWAPIRPVLKPEYYPDETPVYKPTAYMEDPIFFGSGY